MRIFELADRLGFPVITLIDTPGADPSVRSEQRGQAGAIARSMLTMARLTVPSVAVVIGEGGSGGALAIAVADRVAYAREPGLLGHLPRGLRLDPLARRLERPQGRRRLQADGARLPRSSA